MPVSAAPPYMLIDGVMMPGAYTTVLHSSGISDLLALYADTPLAEIKNAGPLLVQLSPGCVLLEQMQAFTHQWPARASLLYTTAPTHVLARHLRRFIAPLDVHGGKGLLRFADPLVTRHWLGSYQGASLDALLGPIDAWEVVESPHAWRTDLAHQWRRFERVSVAAQWADSHAVLGLSQLDALNEASRWQYLERLYGHLAEHCPQSLALADHTSLEEWFNARLEEAEAWGLSTYRSKTTWVEYSLHWGAGFATHANGPYQQWLARTPGASKLTPELRLQHMDDDCLHSALKRDAR